ncbi:hypothetical protein MSG28_012716 [Choristoneura fumiferana]|uniref:Uncharacterized protein n=1 Tax=Choristoneura fumiferana TaxID=7141 RepID=A0ACC0JHV1_CHOFU|nr:hypothetical protein MSG28_012716 [Choristoneura fumiferana]
MLTPISGIKIQNKHRRRSCQLSIQYGHLFHSVNAASLALINAGIPTRGVLVASSASMAWRGAEPQPLVDVGHVEEAAGGVCLTVAAMPTIGSIALLEMSHRLHMDYFDLVFSRAMQGCKDIQKQRTKLNQYHHLLRYKLLDRFKSIVAGFADSYALAADKCKATVKSVSLRVAGAGPARRGLFGGEQQEVGAGGEGAAASKDMVETARSWARPLAPFFRSKRLQLESVGNINVIVRRHTLRPVFAPLLRSRGAERKRVTQLRRLLADAGLLYSQLQDAWTNHKLEGTPPLRALYTLRPRAPERKRVTQLRRLLADAGLLYSQLQDAWTNHKLEGTPPLRALYTLRPRARGKRVTQLRGCWPTPGCSTRSCRTPGPTTSWKVRPHCVLCTHCGCTPICARNPLEWGKKPF